MRTLRKRAALLLLALVLCLPATSVQAASINMTQTMADGGVSHSIALSLTGNVYVWGSNAQMQLASADTNLKQSTPTRVSDLSDVISVAAGHDYSVVLRSDGAVYTWGGSKQSSPTRVDGLDNIIAVAAGQAGILALDRNGNVWQWNLGDVPAQVPGLSSIAVIDAGGSHYLALSSVGEVYAWGDNWSGQLGIGSTTNSSTPTKLNLHNIVDIAAGQTHSLAVTFDGAVYAWGSNSYGQLGNGTTADSTVPVPVSSIENAVQVSAGSDISLARTQDDRIFAWGYGEYGQLGHDNAPFTQSSPQAVTDVNEPPAFIACGVYHNIYVSKSSHLYTWGRNNDQQLGIQQSGDADTPKPVTDVLTTVGRTYSINVLTAASSWALPELKTLYERNMISPILWQDFQQDITRAEFVHLLVTVHNAKFSHIAASSTKPSSFSDLSGNIFAADIIKAYGLGITSGTSDTTFSPDNPLTRQEAAKLLCTFLGKMRGIDIPLDVTRISYYTDAYTISDWAIPYVAYAHDENIMQGSGTNFNPTDNLSREQSLLMVGRMIEKYQWY